MRYLVKGLRIDSNEELSRVIEAESEDEAAKIARGEGIFPFDVFLVPHRENSLAEHSSVSPGQPGAIKMNLVNCQDCGKEVSKNAETCVHCGAPLSVSPQQKAIQRGKNTTRIGLGLFYFGLGLWILFMLRGCTI